MKLPHSITLLTAALTSLVSVAHAADYNVTVTNLTTGIHFTPLIISAHSGDTDIFKPGSTASAELQAIAEGGNTLGMAMLLENSGATVLTGDGLIAPGASTSFTLSNVGSNNALLSVAGMLLPTNDGFVGLASAPLPHGDGETKTWHALGYDAGTEANNELVGGGAPGVAGFPAPPPVVGTGTGTGGTGINAPVEGFISIHRGVLGDLNSTGGVSDINSAVHQWHNPVAIISVTKLADTASGNDLSSVAELTGLAYSSTAVEIFWASATSSSSGVSNYQVLRNAELVDMRDGLSYFDEGLQPDTSYTYEVRAVDINGGTGPGRSVTVKTNAH